MTPSSASPKNSATTGTLRPVSTVASAIGRPLGETGSARPPTTLRALAPVEAPPAAEVPDVNGLVASLPQPLSSLLSTRRRWREWVDPEHGFECELVGFDLAGIEDEADAGVRATAAREAEALRQLCRPLAFPALAKELARLRVSVAKRPEGDVDYKAAVAVYAEELGKYPADLVVAALRTWARAERFWPTLAELHDRIGPKARRRLALLEALERIAEGRP